MDYDSYLQLLQSSYEEYKILSNNLEVKFQETFTWADSRLSAIYKCIEENNKKKSVISSKSRKRCMDLVIKEEENEDDQSEKHDNFDGKHQLTTEFDGSEKQVTELSQRTRRNASKKARAAINELSKLTLGTKLRRPENPTNFQSMFIKLEKIDDKENIDSSNEKELNTLNNEIGQSRVNNTLCSKNNTNLNSNYNTLAKEIKKEMVDEDFLMPPPQALKIKKNKKLVKRSIKRTNSKKLSCRSVLPDDENDIIEIKTNKMSIVNIDSDNEDEDDNENISNEADKFNISENITEESRSCDSTDEKQEKSTFETLEKNCVEHRLNVYQNSEKNTKQNIEESEEQTEFILKDCSVALSKLTLPDKEDSNKLDKQPSYKSTLLDVTVTLEKTYLLNETYCKQNLPLIEKSNEKKLNIPAVVLKKDIKNDSPLITDDDSSSDFKTPEKILPIVKKSKLKQPSLFSPYTNDPVRKRVEAFEKLEKDNTSSGTKETIRITRTKSRALAAAKEAKEKESDSDSKENQKNLSKAEKNTPLNVKRMPITAQFSNKPSAKSTPMTKSTESLKSVCSVKLISNDKKDVQSKKEALLQARIEEQRKKREEKALKAQQTREILERERQHAILQAEREKEEKQRQFQADREEMLRKEAQRKKALAAQRAAETEERRKAEEAARLAKLQEQDEAERRAELQRKKEQEEAERLHQKRLAEEREAEIIRAQARANKKAIMKAKPFNKTKTDTTPMPNVPCSKVPVKEDHLFDSGESTDDEQNPKRPIPFWSSRENRMKSVKEQFYIPSNIISTFFSCKPTVIDVTEIFDRVRSPDLRRNSSAVWRTPPRYSQMPKY